MKRFVEKGVLNRGWRVADILCFKVFNSSGRKLGVLCEVMTTGGNDVWVVKYNNKEILVPALKSVVKQVSLDEKKITVDLPSGCEEVSANGNFSEDDIEYEGHRVYED